MNDGQSNEPNFGRIHLAGQYPTFNEASVLPVIRKSWSRQIENIQGGGFGSPSCFPGALLASKENLQ
jgi:hypothetical protein